MKALKDLKEVRVIIDMNVETGEYDVTFRNLTNPGESMDYQFIEKMLVKILNNLDNKVDCVGEC